MAALISIIVDPCKSHHVSGSRTFHMCNQSETVREILDKFSKPSTNHSLEAAKDDNGPWTKMPCMDTPVLTLSGLFGVRHLRVVCECADTTLDHDVEPSQQSSTKNVFTLMMDNTRRKTLPEKKTNRCESCFPVYKVELSLFAWLLYCYITSSRIKEGLTQKDVLYNHLIDDFKERRIGFPSTVVQSEGAYVTQVLCNALWYITNHHQRINETARRKKTVSSIPAVFDKYQDYNNIRRKKIKQPQLRSSDLYTHSQALFSLCLRPQMKYSPEWEELHNDIKSLAECLHSYKLELDKQNDLVSANHEKNHPVRPVSENVTVEMRHKTSAGVLPQYSILDKALNEANEMEPILFDEDQHLNEAFQNNMQRHRFIENLQLSVPVNLLKYCPGGSLVTIVVLAKSSINDLSLSETNAAQLFAKVKTHLPEFHTRTQRKLFKERLSNIAHVQPSIADLIYKELALDSTVSAHPETQQRLRLIFLGEKGLLQDMRHINAGRPTGKFDVFFEKITEVVEGVTAADERRHNIAHLSQWVSLKELIQQAAEKCPPDTPIPSKSLVRLQFTPRNPYLHAALNFTSKIPVQYKIQKRQLRVSHPDDHYCAAQFRYLKEMAVEEKDHVTLICSDDKAKIPIGNPGVAVSTGVRGKKTLAPTSTTLAACDHDMTSSSLTPSVYLMCQIPSTAEKSFVRGQVTVTVNDSVLQPSSPFRHTVNIIHALQDKPDKTKILMKYSDGGTDQRNTLESVKCASICLFKILDLDLLVLARCAPGHSWVNPAERVMSILNLGLQNCALERPRCSTETEQKLKSASSMAKVRILATKHAVLKEEWSDAIQMVKSTVNERFLRLSLKGEKFNCIDPATEEAVEMVKQPLRELFPTLNLDNLRKDHTKKVTDYQKWLEQHCRQRQYTFQIRKCKDEKCCSPQELSDAEIAWLPDPVLDESGEHFQPYSAVKGTDTTESSRPTLLQKKVLNPKTGQKRTRTAVDTRAPTAAQPLNESQGPTPVVLSAQNARFTAECVECRKPRVIFAKARLTERQQVLLAKLLSEFDFTCGSPIAPPSHPMQKLLHLRPSSCEDPIELPYYSSKLWRSDLCCHCGIPDSEVDNELKKKFKTVLPVCTSCLSKQKQPICQRPYGPSKAIQQ